MSSAASSRPRSPACSPSTATRSLGPAKPSIPTLAASWRLASCTYRLPGPTTTSTRSTVSVPYASAAIAWAPPILYTRSTPHRRQVPRIVRSISPSAPGGEQTTTSSTPAARAVTTPITTVLGYGARPPGTYTAAAPTGTSRSVTLWPCGNCTVRSASTPAWATIATFAIATCSPATSSSGNDLIAASSSPAPPPTASARLPPVSKRRV